MNTDSALTVWIVDDDESIRWILDRALTQDGMDATCFPGAAELLDALGESAPDVIICDIRMAGVDGLELTHRVHATHPTLPVIIITAHSDLDAAVAAFKAGAFEYLPKPFDIDAVTGLVRRAAASRSEPTATSPVSDAPLIGEAPAMQALFRAIGRLSSSQVTVLINGESGTGKELIARALHQNSPRAARPFIAVNTAAIPKDLMESEFFGHERGAFTGATAQRRGRFEQADGGTLFLDEIGDMPADLQTSLLRVLQEGEFYRVGGVNAVRVDVRVIAATHQDLDALVRNGRFREDLYHRLNVIRLRVPPLRERREDIPLLLQRFLGSAAKELKTSPKRMRADVIARLQQHDWPGNVRELENVCRRLTVMAPGQEILPQDLPPELGDSAPPEAGISNASWQDALHRWIHEQLNQGETPLLAQAGPAFERVLIEVALEHSGGQRGKAAQLLGWGRNTLTRKIKELGIEGREA